MLRVIQANIKQAFCSKGFLAGTIGIAIVLLLSAIEQIIAGFRAEGLLEYGFHHYMILEALSSDAMTLILPIAAALPFTASFLEDYKSGFIKEYLPRVGTARYIGGKLAGCALSGGLVLAAGVAAAYAISALFLTPMEAVPEKDAVSMNYFGEIMGRVVLFFFSGAFWALIGMLFATLTGSRYMAYASPFVVYYVLIILYERYFDTLYVLYPKEWIAPSEQWLYGNTGVIIFLVELILLAAIGCGAAMRKKMQNI